MTTTIKLVNINPDDYILAIRAAKSFANEDKPVGVRHGSCYGYKDYEEDPTIWFYVYRTKTMIVVRDNN